MVVHIGVIQGHKFVKQPPSRYRSFPVQILSGTDHSRYRYLLQLYSLVSSLHAPPAKKLCFLGSIQECRKDLPYKLNYILFSIMCTVCVVQVSMKTAVLRSQFHWSIILGVLGSLTTSTPLLIKSSLPIYLGLLITSLQTCLSHFQFTETQQATSLYCSRKSTLPSGTIISLDTPLSFVWGLVGSGSKLVYYRM